MFDGRGNNRESVEDLEKHCMFSHVHVFSTSDDVVLLVARQIKSRVECGCKSITYVYLLLGLPVIIYVDIIGTFFSLAIPFLSPP
jgi:hypothetical protein